MYDVYKKSRRGDYYNTRNTTTANSNTTTGTNDRSGKNKAPDLTLQLCTINIYDEPLIGTIRTIDEDLEANEAPTITTTVADFGSDVIIELSTNNENETICPICLNEYVSNDTVFRNDPKKCRHTFHTECILTWIQRNSPTPECPCCRSRIAVTKDFGESDQANVRGCGFDCDVELPVPTTAST
jgi:Ring finger domain